VILQLGQASDYALSVDPIAFQCIRFTICSRSKYNSDYV